jgi:hypothetical protein
LTAVQPDNSAKHVNESSGKEERAMAKKRTVVKSAAKTGKTAATDRCRPLREQIKRVEAEIADIRSDLVDPDIPPRIKARLRLLLKKDLLLLAQLRAALKRCEALPERPALK